MKRVKRPVYEEVLECEYCKSIWTTNVTYPSYNAGFQVCTVCNKEGCKNCSTWMSPLGKKYTYHYKCEKGLPKSVLKAMKKQSDEYDAQQRWGEFVNKR